MCGVWRERVRVEVGVVLEGTFGRGRTCGSSVSAAVTDDSGRGGFGVSGSKNILLVFVCCQFILFRKRLFIIIVTNFISKKETNFSHLTWLNDKILIFRILLIVNSQKEKAGRK